MHVSANKDRATVNCAVFTPEGRRCLTANLRGQFTLWNGSSFNFETILQAHETPIRAMGKTNNVKHRDGTIETILRLIIV